MRIQKNLKLSFHNVIHETEDVFRVLLESRRLLNSAWELLEGLIYGPGMFSGFNFCPYLIITVVPDPDLWGIASGNCSSIIYLIIESNAPSN